MTNNILKAWNAGFTKRWHTHPIMSDTVDYDSGHQQRMTILTLLLWSDASRDLIVATTIHDQGECDVGDLAHPAKKKHPAIRDLAWEIEMQSIADQGLVFPKLSDEDQRRLHFVDWLDAFLFVMRTHPRVLTQSAWRNQLREHKIIARELDCDRKVEDLLDAAREFYIPPVSLWESLLRLFWWQK